MQAILTAIPFWFVGIIGRRPQPCSDFVFNATAQVPAQQPPKPTAAIPSESDKLTALRAQVDAELSSKVSLSLRAAGKIGRPVGVRLSNPASAGYLLSTLV
jgi:hypothetical protein